MNDIPTVEMVQCQVTGEIVPASECEYVTIKILRKKGADMSGFSPFKKAPVMAPSPMLQVVPPHPTQLRSEQPMENHRDIQLPEPGKPVMIPIEPKNELPDKPRRIVPPHILATMRTAGTPGAAEEVRNV